MLFNTTKYQEIKSKHFIYSSLASSFELKPKVLSSEDILSSNVFCDVLSII